MSVITFIGALAIPVATSYAIIKGADAMIKDLLGKEKPITTIKFKEWSVGNDR